MKMSKTKPRISVITIVHDKLLVVQFVTMVT